MVNSAYTQPESKARGSLLCIYPSPSARGKLPWPRFEGHIYAEYTQVHDSYNIYTNSQVKTPLLPACDLKWRSAALLGSGKMLQRKPPWALAK